MAHPGLTKSAAYDPFKSVSPINPIQSISNGSMGLPFTPETLGYSESTVIQFMHL